MNRFSCPPHICPICYSATPLNCNPSFNYPFQANCNSQYQYVINWADGSAHNLYCDGSHQSFTDTASDITFKGSCTCSIQQNTSSTISTNAVNTSTNT